MTDSKTIAVDFINWAEGFEALAKIVQLRHENWRPAFRRGECAKEEKLWDEAEADIQQHFFARYPDTQSFWREYLDTFDQNFPVKPGYEADAEKNKADILQDALRWNRIPGSCQPLDLSGLHFQAHSCLRNILWRRGYSTSQEDIGQNRTYVKIKRDFKPS